MAPRIQPWPLYRICLASASNLVDQACTNIFLEHGSYANQDCLDAVSKLQKHLISFMPLTLFEQLAEDRNSRNRNNNPLFLWSKDPRIKLALFLHPSMRKFTVDGKGNELLFLQQGTDDFGNNGTSGLDDFFWCAHIRRLVNLVELNLNLIATDEILLLVGNYCSKLEVVNIVSRIKQDYVHQENLTDGLFNNGANAPNTTPIFPAISLRFCVSDVGLASLVKCKSLRKVVIQNTNNMAMQNRGITLSGVRQLVKALPHLEIVAFGSLGKVLKNGFDLDDQPCLKLAHFYEIDPAFVNVNHLQKLCPNLTHIVLSVPISMNENGGVEANVNHCAHILQSLADSSLPLRSIEMQHFPYCSAFENLLKAKGQRLSKLVFRAVNSISSRHLMFIGQHCPALQELSLKDLGGDENAIEESLMTSKEIQSNNYFSQLQVLNIGGRGWNTKTVLPILLMCATQITKCIFLNLNCRISMDPAWQRIMSGNKLACLTSLNLYSGCHVSMSLVRKLTMECPKLTFFSFIQTDNHESAEVERLRLEVTRKNYNIKLCCLEVPYDA